jgi:DNA-binding FrmR family transcriptional regulator
MIDEKTKIEAQRRLKSIAGQIGGIRRMIEDERYCVDILTQISAVRAALESLAMVILRRHIESCVAEAITSGTEEERARKIDELMDVFSRFSGI